MPDTIAVLTGDIVRSSALSPQALDAAMGVLSRAADAAADWRGGRARFTRFRGDGWQCLAPSPPLALRAALFLRAHLRATGRHLETRVAIGIGPGSVPEGPDLAAAGGAAFRLAGHLLDRMGRGNRLAIGWEEPPAGAGKDAAILALCDEISRRWTPAQAAILRHLLVPEPPIQAEVARQAAVTQQMVAKHLRNAGAAALEVALEAVEGGARHA